VSELAIKVDGLSKEYQVVKDRLVQTTETLWESLKHGFKRKLTNQKDSFWGLKDVSFEVKKGEVFGIVGANGAGKSTLLKILSGITVPTKGYAEVNGRVTSLLEVGTGFHPELTGRDNIFMNGSVLGMQKEDIKRKFNDIVAFSEIGKFIDTPVKHYSSGMQVRLAFAVAIHLDAEILIIDEVLSVGDFAFQQKSMKAIKSMLKNNTTVLMVSHNIESIRNLCDRVMILNEGKVWSSGFARDQIVRYLDLMRIKEEKLPSFKNWNSKTAPGNKDFRIKSVWIKAKNKDIHDKILKSDELELGVEFCVLANTMCLDVAFRINDMSRYRLLGVLSDRDVDDEMFGEYKATCSLQGHVFNYGEFVVDIRFLKQKEQGGYFELDNVIALNIDLDEGCSERNIQILPGPLNLKSEWEFSTRSIIENNK
jgi:lipopolysaccharide transport system ATP-binding protein